MVYQTRYLHVPAQGGGAAPPIRFTILVVDLAAIICVYVSLGLYHRWVPSADNFSVFYAGPSGNDWENPVVHSVLVVSFFWTNFIYSRTALNHWIYLCSEFFITAALLGCTIPAFILSPLQGAHGIDRYCSYVFEGRFSVYETSGTCSEKYTALQRLQTAAFSLTFVVAFLHLLLFCIAWENSKGLGNANAKGVIRDIEKGESMTKRSESESGSEPEPLMYGAAPMPEVVAGTDSMRAPASTIAPKPVPGPDTLPRQQLEAIRVPESQYEQREAVRASQSLPLHEV